MAKDLKIDFNDDISTEGDAPKITQRERHLKLLKDKQNPPSDYFYQIGNPLELAKIGRSFLDDFKQGIRSFAITSTDYKASQQRTVLALACYFDHLYDMKILVISDSLNHGMFGEVIQGSKKEQIHIEGTSKHIEVNHFHHHFDLIDLNKLQELNQQEKPNYDFEHTIQTLLKGYDIIFWDTPTLGVFRGKASSYSQTLGFIESLTIIVSQAVSHSKDVNDLKEYFSSFGVNIKGVVFDKLNTEDVKKKTKKWGIFAF